MLAKILLVTAVCVQHFQSGLCPFGSSCFYLHRLADGTVEETTPPRIVYSARGSEPVGEDGSFASAATYVSGNMLGDFVASQLSAHNRRR